MFFEIDYCIERWNEIVHAKTIELMISILRDWLSKGTFGSDFRTDSSDDFLAYEPLLS